MPNYEIPEIYLPKNPADFKDIRDLVKEAFFEEDLTCVFCGKEATRHTFILDPEEDRIDKLLLITEGNPELDTAEYATCWQRPGKEEL